MISLKSVMTSPVLTVTPESVIADAVVLMEQQGISALVVVDEKIPVGIFTERSLLHLATSGDFDPNQAIQEVLTRKPITANSEIDIHEAYLLFMQHKIRHLIVVDHAGVLIGIATETDFLHSLGLEYFVSFNDVTNVTTKNVIFLEPDDAVFSAMQLMHSNNISSIVIVEALRPTGIITERDIVRLIRAEIDLQSTPLKDVMSHPILTVTADISAHSAAELIRKNRIRRLVITGTDGTLAGIITETDILTGLQSNYINLLKEIIDKQVGQLQTVRQQLNDKMILESMMHSANDIAFVVTDLDYQILHSNKTAEKLFEYSLQDAKAIGIPKILQKEWEGQNSIDLVVEQIEKQGKYSSTYKKKGDSGTCYVEVNIFGIKSKDNQIQGYVLIAKDITNKIETSLRLKNRGEELEETNAALRVLLKQREIDKEEMSQSLQQNIEKLVLPFFNKLRSNIINPDQENIIKSIENNLRQISSPFAHRLSSLYSNLTPSEIQIANLIKNGLFVNKGQMET